MAYTREQRVAAGRAGGKSGNKRKSYPELERLPVGGVVVLPWKRNERGEIIPGEPQKPIARAAKRAALRLGVTFRFSGTGAGLRVTRTA